MSENDDVRESDPKTNFVQCLVSNVSLYRLPSNLRLDSIDFEQCILDCVRSRLNDDKAESVLSKRIVSEIKIHKDLKGDNSEFDEETKLDGTHRFIVSIHADKLLWTVVKSEEQIDKFDIRQHCCYLQTCFEDIKLCYVNFQHPNVIIWLLSSIPQKVVKNESLIAKCHNQKSQTNLAKNESLFALVWKCFGENDVVKLRELHKHLRSTKKLKQIDSNILSLGGLPTTIRSKNFIQKTSELARKDEMNSFSYNGVDLDYLTRNSYPVNFEMHLYKSAKHLFVSQHFPHKVSPQNVHRQRHPAKLIQDNSFSSHLMQTSRSLIDQKHDMYYVGPRKANISHACAYHIASESEFDTTQMTNYLQANKRLYKSNIKNNLTCRTRSRSVESPRQRLRLSCKQANDNLEVILPTYHLFKTDSSKKNIMQFIDSKENKESNLKETPDNLNSEGSSISGESTSGEFSSTQTDDDSLKTAKLKPDAETKSTPVAVKSALKKSTSCFDDISSPSHTNGYFLFSPLITERLKFGTNRKKPNNSRQYSNYNKKNVTFSAYATIQVMEN